MDWWQWALVIAGMAACPVVAGHYVAQLQRDPEYQARLAETRAALEELQVSFAHAIGAVWLVNRMQAALDWWDRRRGRD